MKTITFCFLALAASAYVIITPPNEHIVFDGRCDQTNPKQPTFGWSDSGFRLAFRNSTFVQVTIKDQKSPACWYHIWIDGGSVYSGENNQAEMIFGADRFDPTKDVHVIRVAKRSEVMDGGNILESIVLSDGAQTVPLPAEHVHKHKLEFIGDSSACGYGVLGMDLNCPANLESLDGTSSYPEFVAQAFNADLHLQCWSGIGVFMNCDSSGPAEKPMPYVYKYTTTEENGVLWNMSSYHPDAIVMILGSNDYASSNTYTPTDDEFIGAWVAFAKELLAAHPDMHLFCGTMSWNDVCKANVKTACSMLGERCTHVPMVRWSANEDLGCNGHPNVRYERTMAETVITTIRETLGW